MFPIIVLFMVGRRTFYLLLVFQDAYDALPQVSTFIILCIAATTLQLYLPGIVVWLLR